VSPSSSPVVVLVVLARALVRRRPRPRRARVARARHRARERRRSIARRASRRPTASSETPLETRKSNQTKECNLRDRFDRSSAFRSLGASVDARSTRRDVTLARPRFAIARIDASRFAATLELELEIKTPDDVTDDRRRLER
jgi:hypothetical protein